MISISAQSALGRDIVSSLDKAHTVGLLFQLFQAGKGNFHSSLPPRNSESSALRDHFLVIRQSPSYLTEEEKKTDFMNKIPSQAIHRRVSLKFRQDKAMT